MMITYQYLVYQQYIPAAYHTNDLNVVHEWQAKVQQVYQTLDVDEHQLLAINNVFVEMRRLRVRAGG